MCGFMRKWNPCSLLRTSHLLSNIMWGTLLHISNLPALLSPSFTFHTSPCGLFPSELIWTCGCCKQLARFAEGWSALFAKACTYLVRTTQTQKKRWQTYMPRVGIEPAMPVLGRVLEGADTNRYQQHWTNEISVHDWLPLEECYWALFYMPRYTFLYIFYTVCCMSSENHGFASSFLRVPKLGAPFIIIRHTSELLRGSEKRKILSLSTRKLLGCKRSSFEI
jgi:hypothetical protein